MIFSSLDDFYEKAGLCHVLTRQEETECAWRMKNGDAAAREQLIRSYLPLLARHIRGKNARMQNLVFVLYCQHALERAVDSFDFLQDSESFAHRLNWRLRQAAAEYIVRYQKAVTGFGKRSD